MMVDELDLAEAQALIGALEERQGSEPAPAGLPDHLPPKAIKRLEALFQPRALAESHLSELRQVLGRGAVFDPLLIFQVGTDPYVIDGHHRLTAYERAKVTAPVPVRYFAGTVRAAMVEAGALNHKAKLPMDNQARVNRAWRLVLLGGFSKREESEGSGVSESQVAKMRRAKKELGDAAGQYETWWRAHRAFMGLPTATLDDDELEAWIERQAGDYALRLRQQFGSKLTDNIEVAARTLEVYFGRRLPDLLAELRPITGAADEFESEADF